MSDLKTCPFCGSTIKMAAKKCKHCGKWLETKLCPYCGEDIEMSATKCKHCGELLTTDDPKKKDEEQQENVAHAEHDVRMTPNTTKDNSGNTGAAILVVLGFSCVWFGLIIGFVAFVLHITVPSSERMEQAIASDVYDSVKDKSASTIGIFSSGLGELASMVFDLDETNNLVMDQFYQVNEVVIDESFCWSVGRIRNANHPGEGAVAAFGILGIVFPMVDWNDFDMPKFNESEEVATDENDEVEYETYDSNKAETEYNRFEDVHDDSICKNWELEGYIIRDGTQYPIKLSFYQNGYTLENCIYTNVKFGGKLRMVAYITDDGFQFEGKDGNKDFIIKVSQNGHEWTGYSSVGDGNLYTSLSEVTDEHNN